MKLNLKTAAAAMLALTALLSAGCSGKTDSIETGAGVVSQAPVTAEPTEALPTPKPTPEPTPEPTEDPSVIRPICEAELNEITARNEYSSETQRIMVESALSLYGKVSYFWGGKSYHKGFDPEWGKPYKVTSAGDPTTGEIHPYGLDCSGYISWCGVQLGKGAKWTSKNIGEGTWHQWSNSVDVEAGDIRLGDVVFQNTYPGAETQHVGIVVGFLENGDPVIAHCSCTEGGVVVTTAGDTFNFYRRFKFMIG